MRTALILLALLAIAAIPGSLVPQRAADPNGVIRFRQENEQLFAFFESVQLFDVYTSVWFTAVYLLLFVSLIGCIIPRTRHHLRVLRQKPPQAPRSFSRVPAAVASSIVGPVADREVADAARQALRQRRYRLRAAEDDRHGDVSSERGFLRETGNLVFHVAMLGILVSIAVLQGFGFKGQAVVIEGNAFVSAPIGFDSYEPGRLFTESQLPLFSLQLDDFSSRYVRTPGPDFGQPTAFTANFTVSDAQKPARPVTIEVNQPATIEGMRVFLLGNGYAPLLTVRDDTGKVVYAERVPFLPRDSDMTSLGIIKLPHGLQDQLGLVGYLYPTATTDDAGELTSGHPEPLNPLIVLNVFEGDLGLDDGTPQNVYRLDTSRLTQITGADTGVESLTLQLGEEVPLPHGLGTIAFEAELRQGGIARFVSIDFHRDLTQVPVLGSATVGAVALILSFLIPRRRVWVRCEQQGEHVSVLVAGIARGHDSRLFASVDAIAADIRNRLDAARP